MMRRVLSLFVILSGLFPCKPACAEDKTLNIFIWSGTIASEVIKKFQDETGIRVVVNQYDNDDTAEAKLLTGESGFDVMTVTLTPHFMREAKLGLFHALPVETLPNLENISPALRKILIQYEVPIKYGVPYLWGTIGFGLNQTKLAHLLPDFAKEDVASLAYDPEHLKKISACGVYFLDSPQEVFRAILQYLKSKGLIENAALTPENVVLAQEHLEKIKPYIRNFESFADRILDLLYNEEGCLVQCYSSDCLSAMREASAHGKGETLIYKTPKEGTVLWVDMLVIPTSAVHPQNAAHFINFLLRPEIAALNTRLTQQATSVIASLEHLPESYRKNPHFKPSDALLKGLEIYPPLSFRQEKRVTRAWYKAKTGV